MSSKCYPLRRTPASQISANSYSSSNNITPILPPFTMPKLPSPTELPASLFQSAIRPSFVIPFLHPVVAARYYNRQWRLSSHKTPETPSTTTDSHIKKAVATERSPTATPIIPDRLADGDALGRTGGGKPLSSSVHPSAKPKISNASVPGHKPHLTKEQQAEVDEHNREFERTHGKVGNEPERDDRVDKSFWSGRGARSGTTKT